MEVAELLELVAVVLEYLVMVMLCSEFKYWSQYNGRLLPLLKNGKLWPCMFKAIIKIFFLTVTHAALTFFLLQSELAELCTVSERYCGTQGGGMDQSIAFMADKGQVRNFHNFCYVWFCWRMCMRCELHSHKIYEITK